MAFQRVAKLSDVPTTRGLRVEVGAKEIGLYRVGDTVYAMDDRCPHAGWSLSEGDLDGTLVLCPGHAWDFDVCTGLGPGVDDGAPIPRYPVELRDDEVWLDPEAPLG